MAKKDTTTEEEQAPNPLIISRAQLEALTAEEQQAFRNRGGTVTEN